MKVTELIQFLRRELREHGDGEVVVSVDVSTGDADLGNRAFGSFLGDSVRKGSELTLLATGELNFKVPKSKG